MNQGYRAMVGGKEPVSRDQQRLPSAAVVRFFFFTFGLHMHVCDHGAFLIRITPRWLPWVTVFCWGRCQVVRDGGEGNDFLRLRAHVGASPF